MRKKRRLILVVGVFGVVNRVVQPTTFLSFHGLSGDEIAHVYHVSQFADVAGGFDALEEFLGFFIEEVEPGPGAFQTKVGADDADIF